MLRYSLLFTLIVCGNSFSFHPGSIHNHRGQLSVHSVGASARRNKRNCQNELQLYTSRTGNPTHSKNEQNNQKRTPRNKRMVLRWVVQGVERCLAEQELTSAPTNPRTRFRNNGAERIYTYRRREDASLVDALYLLVNAKSMIEVMNAKKRIQVLMRVGSGGQQSASASPFPIEVIERVIKVTAMTGLIPLSLDLLSSLMHPESKALPSPIAYTAVLNALRKNGRIDRMEETLAALASLSRRITKTLPQSSSNTTGVDVVSFNTYLAALCDAAVDELPFVSSSSDRENDEMNNFDWEFSDANNSTDGATSPSEKYLYKSVNLLKGDVARTRFMLSGDPDLYSYNSILAAAAKCSKSSINANKFTDTIVQACLRGMKDRDIKGDVFTYNARIEAALANKSSDSDNSEGGKDVSPAVTDGEKKAIDLIDQLWADPDIDPDRYTINLALVPFFHAGRRDFIWSMLKTFYQTNANANNSKLVSSAFEAFLNTLVQSGEVDFAREVFGAFFLSSRDRQHKRMQMTNEIKVITRDSSSAMMASPVEMVAMNNRPPPSTRHFNILLGGYRKSYQAAVSRSQTLTDLVSANNTVDNVDTPNNSESDRSNEAIIEAQKAYKLLDIMLDAEVPLDGFSVSSIMAFPNSTEYITSLWKRLEPELCKELNPAAYRSIMSAYGNSGDSSSACWVFFEELSHVCGNKGMSIDSFNTLLGALAQGCIGERRGIPLDVFNSNAATRRGRNNTTNPLVSLVDGKTSLDAAVSILDTMRNGTSIPHGSKLWYIPKPNSQTYCIVASALSGSGTSESNSGFALQLYRKAMDDRVPADGRFLNALLRCFGDDINGALDLWKTGMGAAAAGVKNNDIEGSKQSMMKRSANLIAAYNGLMHVCGRAVRPDIALRIAYAMKKAGVEPTEVSLNCYYAGKRLTLDGGDGGSFLVRSNEQLLSVECTKYNTKDKRRAGDKKIRILF